MYMYTYMHVHSNKYSHKMLGLSYPFFNPMHQPPFLGDILIMSTLYPHYIPHFPLYPHYIPLMYLYICISILYIYIQINRYRQIKVQIQIQIQMQIQIQILDIGIDIDIRYRYQIQIQIQIQIQVDRQIDRQVSYTLWKFNITTEILSFCSMIYQP